MAGAQVYWCRQMKPIQITKAKELQSQATRVHSNKRTKWQSEMKNSSKANQNTSWIKPQWNRQHAVTQWNASQQSKQSVLIWTQHDKFSDPLTIFFKQKKPEAFPLHIQWFGLLLRPRCLLYISNNQNQVVLSEYFHILTESYILSHEDLMC